MKKGQVTLWIVIGLLALLAISLTIYFVTQRDRELIDSENVIPSEVQPVYEYSTSCLEIVGKRGLTILGLQGGYITLPATIARNPKSYVALDDEEVVKVPSWYYRGEDRTPPIEFMERELAGFIQDNIDSCLQDFTSFDDSTIVERSERIPKVEFLEDTVLLELDWTVDIEFLDKTVPVPEIKAQLPVSFKRIWELADKTMKKENEDAFFENMTLDLLAAHPDIPLDGVEFSCGAKRWPLFEVKKDIEELLSKNIAEVRIKNTDYPSFDADESVYKALSQRREEIVQALTAGAENPTFPENPPEDAYYYFRMTHDVGVSAQDLKAGFTYIPSWGLGLNVDPRDGAILKSNQVQGLQKYMRFLCVNQYHFTYDLEYPVVMNIRDDDAFEGEGYTFRFSFPVIMQNNQPKRLLRGHKQFITSFVDTEYCNRLSGREIDMSVETFETGLPFATAQRDVEIVFRCGTEECSLGTTKADDGMYRLRTQLPEGCGNPFITAKKSGYLSGQEVLLSSDNELTLLLTKLKNMSVEIVKHKYYAIDNRLGEAEPLTETQNAVVYITIKDVSVPFDQFLEYPGVRGQEFIELAEDTAKYEVTVFVHDAFDTLIAGFVSQELEITYDDIATHDTIVLHALQPATIPSTDEGRAKALGLIFSEDFKEDLKPTFK